MRGNGIQALPWCVRDFIRGEAAASQGSQSFICIDAAKALPQSCAASLSIMQV